MTCCSHPLCDPESTTMFVWLCSVLRPVGRGLYVDSVVGGYGGRGTPGPIPNPVAKPSCADGTALDRVWESRTPPEHTFTKGDPDSGSPFVVSVRDFDP